MEEEVLSFLEASRSRKTRKSFFFLLFFHFFPFPPNLTFARAFRYALRCSFRFVFGTFTESAISAAREREKKRENKLKRKRKRRRRCSSSERDVFDVNVVTIIFSFSLSLNPDTRTRALHTRRNKRQKPRFSQRERRSNNHGARCRAWPPPRRPRGAPRSCSLLRGAMLPRRASPDVGSHHSEDGQEG